MNLAMQIRKQVAKSLENQMVQNLADRRLSGYQASSLNFLRDMADHNRPMTEKQSNWFLKIFDAEAVEGIGVTLTKGDEVKRYLVDIDVMKQLIEQEA